MNRHLSGLTRRAYFLEQRAMHSSLGPADFFRQLQQQPEFCAKAGLWAECLRARVRSGVCCLPDSLLWLGQAFCLSCTGRGNQAAVLQEHEEEAQASLQEQDSEGSS